MARLAGTPLGVVLTLGYDAATIRRVGTLTLKNFDTYKELDDADETVANDLEEIARTLLLAALDMEAAIERVKRLI